MMTAYYNEFDPNAAAWLRELIKQGLIADGIVDERSIIDVSANDLAEFTQCHFFAGIGGWSRSLRLANWQDDKPVWTASLPCQPFSTAGKQLGKSDERHLLPHFLELVKQCRPDTLFGEQVEAAIRHGWLDDLQTAMEAENYAVGHVILGAHSVGSYHQRQRLYWVANSKGERERRASRFSYRQEEIDESKRGQQDGELVQFIPGGAIDGRMANADGKQAIAANAKRLYAESCGSSGMGNAKHDGHIAITDRRSTKQSEAESGLRESERPSTEWDSPEWLQCRDGKYRPIKPGIKPLVNGLSAGMVYSRDSSAPTNPNETQEARVMRLKGYGNAIVPQVAAEFISVFIELQG